MSKPKNNQKKSQKEIEGNSPQNFCDYGRFGSMKKLDLPTLNDQKILAQGESKEIQ